jgi:hypothetical protein
MPAVAAIIEHGSIPVAGLVDETSLLLQSLTKSGTREPREYLNAAGSVHGIEERNPKLSYNYDAFITNYASGFPSFHPGQEVMSLANFQSATLGFVPGDGTLVFRDPTITESNSEAAKMTFTVVQYPFVS